MAVCSSLHPGGFVGGAVDRAVSSEPSSCVLPVVLDDVIQEPMRGSAKQLIAPRAGRNEERKGGPTAAPTEQPETGRSLKGNEQKQAQPCPHVPGHAGKKRSVRPHASARVDRMFRSATPLSASYGRHRHQVNRYVRSALSSFQMNRLGNEREVRSPWGKKGSG